MENSNNSSSTPLLKSGSEPFRIYGVKTDFTLSNYWQWSASDLLSNTQRGVIAEFLVAKCLGLTALPRREWAWYDLETMEGKKIEVKSAAYRQSWRQKSPSDIRFDIAPRKQIWDPSTNKSHEFPEPRRPSDVYVFCLLGCPEEKNPDPLCIDQWKFYVINTKSLNSWVLPMQRTIGLRPLRNLVKQKTNRCETEYCNLYDMVKKLVNPRDS